MGLTHRDTSGRPAMVDVGDKEATSRVAVATGRIRMSPDAFRQAVAGSLPKGDVESVARLSGIQAAKRTSELLPLCHPLLLTHVDVALTPEEEAHALRVTARVRCSGKTGVEMEALTAATVALLAIYDMIKSVDSGMVIEGVTLLEKRGGRSGTYRRSPEGSERSAARGSADESEDSDSSSSRS